MAQLVGGPFHGHVVEMGDSKPLVMFDQASCMEGAEYLLDPTQCAYIYEGTPSTEGAASLLHCFNAFLKEYEDDSDQSKPRQGTGQHCEISSRNQQGDARVLREGQDEVPPEPQEEVQETFWKEEVTHVDGTSTEDG